MSVPAVMRTPPTDLRALPRVAVAVAVAVGAAAAPAGFDWLIPRPQPTNAFTAAEVVVEVDFQAGAQPFTGDAAYGDTWDLTVENLEALVGAGPALDVP